MTKVKNSKARKQGTVSSVSAKDQKAVLDKKMVTAVRDGVTRNFSAQIWNNLPEGKQGWSETSEKPAEIKPSSDQDPANTKLSAKDQAIYDEQAAKYKDLFKKDPEEGTSLADLQSLVSTREKELENMEEFKVDQEYLDLNPDRAKEGLKVGDVIQVEKQKGGSN